MRKMFFLLIVLVVILITTGFIYSNQKNQAPKASQEIVEITKEKPQEIKAFFAIYTNGTKRNFSSAMYHNRSEEIFITSSNPNQVIVKKSHTWNDFFKTLPMKLTKNCLITGTGQLFCGDQTNSLKFYINEESHPEALNEKINEGDKLLVTFGLENDQSVQSQIQALESEGRKN